MYSTGAWSEWDHVGIVVPYVEESQLTQQGQEAKLQSSTHHRLGILEINIGGVTLRPLIERLQRSSSNRVAIRRLVSPTKDATQTVQNSPITLTLKKDGTIISCVNSGVGITEDLEFIPRLQLAAARLAGMRYNDNVLHLANSMLLSHISHGMN